MFDLLKLDSLDFHDFDVRLQIIRLFSHEKNPSEKQLERQFMVK